MHWQCIALHRYVLVLHSLTQVCTVVNSLCLIEFREAVFYLSWPWFSSSAPLLPLLFSCLLFPGSVSSQKYPSPFGCMIMVLEGTRNSLIIIPDSPLPIPIPAPGGNLLVEIVDRTDDVAAQANVEDQAERVGRRVMIKEGGVFRVAGELYEEGEDIMDVLWRVEAHDTEVPQYLEAPGYNNPNCIPDRQV